MRLFNRIFWGTVVLAGFGGGCCNIGCKYDLRKYPTPIMSQGKPTTHLWNPEGCSSDLFDKLLPPGYSNTATTPAATATPPSPLPKGPASPSPSKVTVLPPDFSRPLR